MGVTIGVGHQMRSDRKDQAYLCGRIVAIQYKPVLQRQAKRDDTVSDPSFLLTLPVVGAIRPEKGQRIS
jgi:hypothetical protein